MAIIGLKRGIVKLMPYTPEWKRLFEREKWRINGSIGEHILDIQHVGSTSIPGMVAKPIIDIAVAVEDFEQARICIAPLEMLGYEYRGDLGIPRRHYFVLGEMRRFHLHINEIKSTAWEDHILFRDALIKHPKLANEYASLKKDLAQRFPNDRDAYLGGKAPFIERVLKMARADNSRSEEA